MCWGSPHASRQYSNLSLFGPLVSISNYRSSRIVPKRIARSFSVSISANTLLHLVLELEVRIEEFSVHASEAASSHMHISLLSEQVVRIFLPSESLMVL